MAAVLRGGSAFGDDAARIDQDEPVPDALNYGQSNEQFNASVVDEAEAHARNLANAHRAAGGRPGASGGVTTPGLPGVSGVGVGLIGALAMAGEVCRDFQRGACTRGSNCIKMSEEKTTDWKMEYRLLGGTGLKVSALSFGFWATYGVKEGVDKCVEVMRVCRKAGINFFDNAEAYGKENGDAEVIMGQAYERLLKEDATLWRRSDVCFTTKIFWGGKGQNEKGLSRKHVMEGMKESLKRLNMDYVDVVFCHRFDPLTSTEEVVRAFTDVIKSGKALYWGTSEWSAAQITEAFWVAKTEGLIPPIAEQPQYNLFHRERFEKEYSWIFKHPYRFGTTIWSPLASGILTGKYNDGIPEGSRMGTENYEWLRKMFEAEKEQKIEMVRKLQSYAKEKFNTTVTCLAIAWCLKNKNVSTVLLGATSVQQITENLQALDVARKLTKIHLNEIDEIVKNKPKPDADWGRTLELTIQTD